MTWVNYTLTNTVENTNFIKAKNYIDLLVQPCSNHKIFHKLPLFNTVVGAIGFNFECPQLAFHVGIYSPNQCGNAM